MKKDIGIDSLLLLSINSIKSFAINRYVSFKLVKRTIKKAIPLLIFVFLISGMRLCNYEKIISAVNNVRKDFKNSVKTLFPYVIGAVIGIVVLSFVIEYSLKNYELPTLMAFVGLILGGLPPIVKRVENEKFKFTHLISFILF